ncbi:MAG: hypothetical protein GMKNLPBB_01615 [Myxococcota bacterium]|nr:hypothetical protein [Myxococcota bacterium]
MNITVFRPFLFAALVTILLQACGGDDPAAGKDASSPPTDAGGGDGASPGEDGSGTTDGAEPDGSTGSPAVKTVPRRYTFRAIGGFSMGGISSSFIGLRHPEKFDIIGPMGCAVDLLDFIYTLRSEFFGGFCAPPQLGKMCRQPGKPQDFEHIITGSGLGKISRRTLQKDFNGAFISFGNPFSYNPAHPYLAAGFTREFLTKPDDERCKNPVRVENLFDVQYNPEGKFKAISFCDGADVKDEGLFDPSRARNPVDYALAIDLNDNGVRDSGEPVLFQWAEPFRDSGKDGKADKDEPGFDAASNPDPSKDNYDPLNNPYGSEGNNWYDEGEPYDDFGLDGVKDTKDRNKWDFGEGNGKFDFNPNFARFFDYDPIARLPKVDLSRLDFYMDVGIRDEFRFAPNMVKAVSVLKANNVEIQTFEGFDALSPDARDQSQTRIDWASKSRSIFVKYGKKDATPKEIADGDGGHVGTVPQVVDRPLTFLSFVSAHLPGGDYDKVNEMYVTKEFKFFSPAVNGEKSFWAILPPGYNRPDKVYPVVYLLHGIGMDAQDLLAVGAFLGDWQKRGLIQKMIIILPSGECAPGECPSSNFFANQVGWAKPGRNNEDSLVNDLMKYVDDNFKVKKEAIIEVPAEGPNKGWVPSSRPRVGQ